MPQADPSLSIAQRIDLACDRFEAEWKAGKHPRIDEFVSAQPESVQEELRQALLAIELELQGRSEADTSITQSSVRNPAEGLLTATRLHAAMSSEALKKIGRFELRGELGSGAFGKVYRAFDSKLNREVALKVPLDSAIKTDAEREQFLKEARAIATINHPNVCQVFEVGEFGDQPYIVMALVPGLSLADALKSRKTQLPQKQVALIIRKIAAALATAHEKGIVHRDLKPANVMFDRDRKDIVVMDFGLARGPQLADARATQSGVIMGTPAYMSPEQARGDAKGVGPSGDVFSLGVLMYEMLTGCRPFVGTATEIIGQILHVEPERPSQRRAGIDPRMESICLKAMAKDPAARFSTMKELASAIDSVLRESDPSSPHGDAAAKEEKPSGAEERESSGTTNLAGVFAALSADRKKSQAETAAVVEAAIRKTHTPRRVIIALGLVGIFGIATLAALIFFTKSGPVTVTVELNDIDLTDQSLSFFLDDQPISAEALANPIELKPGEHILVVKRGETVVKRMRLNVSGGKNPGIKVKDITPPEPLSPALSPEAEDRKFAEWLLSIEVHSVTVCDPRGTQKAVGKLAELPEGPFRVVSFNMFQNQKVTDADADRFVGWLERSGAESISFHANPIGDATVAKVLAVPTVKRVWLGYTKITSRSAELLGTRPDLKLIEFDGTAITDAWLSHLRGLTELESLSFYATSVGDEGMTHLAGMKSLSNLVIGYTQVTGEGLKRLTVLPIRTLNLMSSKVRDTELGVLTEFRSLRYLDASRLSLADSDVPALVQLAELESLYITESGITDMGIAGFTALKALKQLNLTGNNVSDEGVDSLRKALPKCNVIYDVRAQAANPDRRAAEWAIRAGAPGIEILADGVKVKIPKEGTLPDGPFTIIGINLSQCGSVTDDGTDRLKGLKNIKGLDLGYTPIKQLDFLDEMLSLEHLVLSQTNIDDASLVHLKRLKNLRLLYLHTYWGVGNITDAGIENLKELTELRSLEIYGTRTTDAGLGRLSSLNNLEYLAIGSIENKSEITDNGLAHLAGLVNLKHLRINSTRITSTGLEQLTNLPKLQTLQLVGANFADAGLEHLERFKALKDLYLQGTKITDAGLEHLKTLSNLEALHLEETKLTDAGVQSLQAALPKCMITK